MLISVTALVIMTLRKNFVLAEDNEDDKQTFLDWVGTRELQEKNNKNFLAEELKETKFKRSFQYTVIKFSKPTVEENE